MKLLLTADIHLKKGNSKRIDVLKWLIDKGTALEIDYFIIAGDLFESDADARSLRPEIKKIFEKVSTEFLILPGNHDAKSFNPDYDYGKNVIQLTKIPFEIIKAGELTVCGVPYQNKRFSECIKDIPDQIDLLIAHGTLYDQSFIYSMLDDEETQYMPIHPAHLENIARFVALGHLHSRNIEKKYENTYVIYPGSPVALDTKCNSPRYCYQINIRKNEIKTKRIEVAISPYWNTREFFVFPGNEEKIIETIQNHLMSIKGKDIIPHIVVNGYIAETYKGFQAQLEVIEQNCLEDFPELRIDHAAVQSWDRIIKNPIIKGFVDKTDKLDDELRMKIFEITFPVFSELLE